MKSELSSALMRLPTLSAIKNEGDAIACKICKRLSPLRAKGDDGRYSSALTISSLIFLASPNSIIVLSR